VDFKLENVLVSLHSLKTMGFGAFGASAPLFLRNGELLEHSPILNCRFNAVIFKITALSNHKPGILNNYIRSIVPLLPFACMMYNFLIYCEFVEIKTERKVARKK
jgi:hypothetical protein